MSENTVIVGFIPLLDCAPLVVATELGFAAQEGIEIALVRETSWANIRDRVVVGQFDAAHMLGPMAVAATLGIGHIKTPLIAPCSLGLGGNAITVTNGVWEQMLDHGAYAGANPTTQGRALHALVRARQRAQKPPLTFAMVYPFSCHNYELRYWLAASGIDPDQDVRLIVLPPPLLVDALRENQIDGFCAGAPWNSLAVAVGVGCIVTATSAIWRWSPEKVLGLRLEWAQRHADRLAALIRAICRASQWCGLQDNHRALARLLAEPRFVGAPAESLFCALDGRMTLVPGESAQALPEYFVAHDHAANFPWTSHALWFYTQMVRWQQIAYDASHLPSVRATYRPDLFRLAVQGMQVDVPTTDTKVEGALSVDEADNVVDGFFDRCVFDPGRIEAYVREQCGARDGV